jgi:hypothetical protein
MIRILGVVITFYSQFLPSRGDLPLENLALQQQLSAMVWKQRTSFRSPWQNGIAERFVGCCRRDFLDHVIVLNERHLKRLMHDYIRYFHEDRTHLGLAKGTPAGRLPADGILARHNIYSRLEPLGGVGSVLLPLRAFQIGRTLINKAKSEAVNKAQL